MWTAHPAYSHDLFVSYAHVDDAPLPGATEGWVSVLIGFLQTRLTQKLGRSDAYSLWMDHETVGLQPLTPQILDRLQRTALLIVVLSPGYLASTWCLRELNSFLRVVDQREPGRVLLVEREPVDESNLPRELKDLKAYRFWVKDRAHRAPRILGTPRPDPSDPEYYALVNDLSLEIAGELHRLRRPGSQVQDRSAAHDDSRTGPRPVVCLAQVTDDLETERNNVRRYLDQAGVDVVPQAWYSQEPNAFRRAVEGDLARAELFVQLLSDTAGKKPPDVPLGYPRFQLDLAIVAGKPVLQWRSPSVEVAAIEDADHRRMVESATVHAEGLEDFKDEIRRRLFDRPVLSQQRKPSAFVFVDMESSDHALAEEVCQSLDRYDAEYALPIQSEDPAENRRDLEENLSECDALVVIYGSTTVKWVRHHLLEARKALSQRRRPLKALAIFEGPPEQKEQLGMKFQNMQILDCRAGRLDDEVRRFMEHLRAEGRDER
jgi:hypothetical protein